MNKLFYKVSASLHSLNIKLHNPKMGSISGKKKGEALSKVMTWMQRKEQSEESKGPKNKQNNVV